MIKNRRKGQKGMTLIELIIAFAIIAVALLQLLTVMLSTSNARESARELSVAREAAASKLAEINRKLESFDTIVTTFGSVTDGQTIESTFDVPELTHDDGTNDQGIGTVVIDDTSDDILDVQITITWMTSAGRENTYSTRTLLTR